MTVISVIVGSTREGRFSEKPAKWILQHLKKRERIDARLLDLRDSPIPFFDQVATPATPGRPAFAHEVVRKWTAAIAQADGFVTRTYNYGPSGWRLRTSVGRRGARARIAPVTFSMNDTLSAPMARVVIFKESAGCSVVKMIASSAMALSPL
jgi:NADPH-dependent FMN reductase